MKKITLVFLLVAACAGCATRYNVHLSNGDVITAKGKPHLSKDKNVWLFTDASGRTNGIPSGNVTAISPQSMDNDFSTQFKTTSSK
jgi:Bacterial protein of unknown function (DUF903)